MYRSWTSLLNLFIFFDTLCMELSLFLDLLVASLCKYNWLFYIDFVPGKIEFINQNPFLELSVCKIMTAVSRESFTISCPVRDDS